MEYFDIAITNTTLAKEKVEALATASKELQDTNERISAVTEKVGKYWPNVQEDQVQYCKDLNVCVKKVNTICSCDNELANAVEEYLAAVISTANTTL